MLPELPFGRLTTAPTERFFTSNVILWPRLGLEADLKKRRGDADSFLVESVDWS